ncbi:MAG TPA: carboxypeptidase-like regulatory domain-containing protein, partial [Bacteroidota bacterium]
MNLRTLFVWSAVLILTSFMACEEPTGTDVTVTGQASVSGTVLEENSSPIEGATVLLSSVLGSQSTPSDSLGRFILTVDFDSLQAAVSAKIEASKAGFKRDSTSLFLAPGNNISGLNFVLRADTGAAAPPPSPGASGDASNIVLVNSTSS